MQHMPLLTFIVVRKQDKMFLLWRLNISVECLFLPLRNIQEKNYFIHPELCSTITTHLLQGYALLLHIHNECFMLAVMSAYLNLKHLFEGHTFFSVENYCFNGSVS